jgi:hypothetical protein
MGTLVHTCLGSPYLIAHVFHCPPSPPAHSFIIGPAVINTHAFSFCGTDAAGEAARAPRLRMQREARAADVAARAECKDKAAAAGGATTAPLEHEATGEAAWAPLLRLEREAGVAAAARAASGGRMVQGQEEESEEEHDVLRTYMEIYDDNFDYDF